MGVIIFVYEVIAGQQMIIFPEYFSIVFYCFNILDFTTITLFKEIQKGVERKSESEKDEGGIKTMIIDSLDNMPFIRF